MTPKEAIELVFSIYDTSYGREQLTILNLGLSFEKTKECKDVLKQALNELDELKRDVKRYFELRNKTNSDVFAVGELNEYLALCDKLKKVGHENERN